MLPGHESIHSHDKNLCTACTAPGAAMGGSFPGIIVPAANQSSVPQSGNWCGQVTGFADSERRLRLHVKPAQKRAGVAHVVYEA